MTPSQFKEARHKLGLTTAQTGRIMGVDPRTVRRWESDNDPRPVNPIAAKVVGWMLRGFDPSRYMDNAGKLHR